MSQPLNHADTSCPACHGVGLTSRADAAGVKKARVCPCRLPGGSGKASPGVARSKKLSKLEQLAQSLGG